MDNPITRIGVAVGLTAILMAIVVAILPPTELPIEVENSITWLFDILWDFNWLIPVQTLTYGVALIISADIAILSIKIVLFAKKHLTQQS